MALALSAHTLRVQLSVQSVSACWRSEVGQDTPSRYLHRGKPVTVMIISFDKITKSYQGVGIHKCVMTHLSTPFWYVTHKLHDTLAYICRMPHATKSEYPCHLQFKVVTTVT